MTTSPDENRENLIAQYENGVANRTTVDTVNWLKARSDLEAQWSQLTTAEQERVKKADQTLIHNPEAVKVRSTLRDLRTESPHTADEWWWYLDVLAPVTARFGAPKPVNPREQLFSRIFTVFEVGVLLVALFLLARSFGIIQTPTPAPAPTFTPAPTATLDQSGFDLTTLAVYKAPSDILEIPVPKSWQSTVNNPGDYVFAFGAGRAPTAFMQVQIGAPGPIYAGFGISPTADTPKTALEDLKKNAPDPSFKFSDVQAAKIANLDAQSVTINIAPTGQAAVWAELRVASLPNGQIVFLYLQSTQSAQTLAQPVFTKMIEGVVLNPQFIPTVTPTATLHPLLITATALQGAAQTTATAIQKQIDDLTPTPVPTAAATGAATLSATGAATPQPSTPVATTAAPAAATDIPTTVANTAVPTVAATGAAFSGRDVPPVVFKQIDTTTRNLPDSLLETATVAVTIAPTFDKAAFDMTTASVYKAPKDIIEIPLPKGWQTTVNGFGDYVFAYGDSHAPTAFIEILVGAPGTIYQSFGIKTTVETPQAALEDLKKNVSDPSVKLGNVQAAKIANLDAQSVSVNVDARSGQPAVQGELRVASLPNGQIVFVYLQSLQSVADVAHPVFEKMIEGLVMNPQLIPTATPTATLHPLLITATALQKQINDLTGTPLPTITPAVAATATPAQ